MNFNDEVDADYLAMVELIKEIGSIVQNSINESRDELNPDEIEHVMKISSDVIKKLKKESVERLFYFSSNFSFVHGMPCSRRRASSVIDLNLNFSLKMDSRMRRNDIPEPATHINPATSTLQGLARRFSELLHSHL